MDRRVVTGVFALGLALFACQGGGMQMGEAGQMGPMGEGGVCRGDERIPWTPESDVEFIDGMVPHHEMAVQMADQILARGLSADLKAMAQRMKDTQAVEIEQLKAARLELTGSNAVPPLMDPMMMMDLKELQQLQGEALDQRFLWHMISHHSGAIQMAHNAHPNLERADLRALAEKILADQAREAGEMQRMREGR